MKTVCQICATGWCVDMRGYAQKEFSTVEETRLNAKENQGISGVGEVAEWSKALPC